MPPQHLGADLQHAAIVKQGLREEAVGTGVKLAAHCRLSSEKAEAVGIERGIYSKTGAVTFTQAFE